MDSSTSVAPPPFSIGSLAKVITKFFSLHRATTGSGDGEDDDALYKIKLSENHGHHSRVLPQALSSRCERRKETETLVANIFAVVSAIKAAYAQLQLAQSPYNPDAVQSADRVIITELKRLSELKQSFSSNHLAATSPLAAQVEEQRNLLMTYKIIIAKLEAEIKSKDSEVASLQADLKVAEKRCRTLDARLRPGRTLSSLDELHLSGLNPTHFLTLLRSATKSIRSFVKVMTQEMESAGWDIDAAAAAIQPDISFRRRRSSSLALESYVSYLLFSNFGNPDFGLGGPLKNRLQCFAEFTELKFVKAKECFARNPQFEKFCRGKYLEMVHHKMEVSIFGDLDQRTLVSYGSGCPETKFFERFAEMTRRVWLLHCLFFSFEAVEKKTIFEARKGSRFSDVYMESVAEDEVEDGGVSNNQPVVGFTVMPGFVVGKTVIQCRVYLVYPTAKCNDGRDVVGRNMGQLLTT